MRRILIALCIYVAGLVTLPVGVELISARSGSVRIEQIAETASPRLVHRSHAVPATPIIHRAPSMPAEVVRQTEEGPSDFSAPMQIAQNDRFDADINQPAESLDPFNSKLEVEAVESPFDAPKAQPVPAAPHIVLPVGPETLAGAGPQDEAQVEMLKRLREDLKKIIEEKSAKMSAAALQTEIEMHRQHLSDLNALEELQKLEQSLKELSDKYPNSDSGRRAGELLKVLEQQRRHGTRRAVPIGTQNSFAPLPGNIPFGK